MRDLSRQQFAGKDAARRKLSIRTVSTITNVRFEGSPDQGNQNPAALPAANGPPEQARIEHPVNESDVVLHQTRPGDSFGLSGVYLFQVTFVLIPA